MKISVGSTSTLDEVKVDVAQRELVLLLLLFLLSLLTFTVDEMKVDVAQSELVLHLHF